MSKGPKLVWRLLDNLIVYFHPILMDFCSLDSPKSEFSYKSDYEQLFFFGSNTGFDESKHDREMNRPFVH